MTNLNFLAGFIIILFGAIILAIRIVSINRRGGKFTMEEFIDIYGDNIIDVLKDVIEVLQITMASYQTKEEYESMVISVTIDALKENSVKFGVPAEIVEMFDTEALTSIIMTVYNKSKCEVMSVLSPETIQINEAIIDKEVVDVVGSEATEYVEGYGKEDSVEEDKPIIDSEIEKYIPESAKKEAIE